MCGKNKSGGVSCLSVRYQIAQKLHACTDPLEGQRPNDRAHDLADLILLQELLDADLGDVRAKCRHLLHPGQAAVAAGARRAATLATTVEHHRRGGSLPDDHGHNRGAAALTGGGRYGGRLAVSFVLIFAFFVIEVLAGVATNSLALLPDAGHMFTDVLGLGMALVRRTAFG